VSKPPRVIKPNPKDPDWKFPYASRRAITNLLAIFAKYGRKRSFFIEPNTPVLDKHRPNQIPWESVQPQFRPECQRIFNMLVARERAKGIPGWPSAGKIKSLRMNVTCMGRYRMTGIQKMQYLKYRKQRKMWNLYHDWLAAEARKAELAARGPEQHRVLEVA